MEKNWKITENKIWQPVYGDNEKYIKTKIKTNGDSVITNCHSKKNPKKHASVYQ